MRIKRLMIENFKGCKHLDVDFSERTEIKGANATGKTTIADAFAWLMFGKDSHGNEKFAIRPLDADGNMIDNIEIFVSAVIDIDGKEHVLQKVQKQNWVKKRGSEEAKLQGNVNSCEVDGYPKKDADYKAFIASIIDEDIFKMITNPIHFTNLPWKEQRQILMRFVSDVSDLELAKDNKAFEPIIGELEKAPSTDDIQSKYSRQKKDLTARLKELPVRIDEIEKSKANIDVAEIELHKNLLTEKISGVEEKIEKAKDLVGKAKAQADFSIAVNNYKAYEKDFYKQRDIEKLKYNDNLRQADFNVESANRNLEAVQDRVTEIECRINALKESKKELAQAYKDTQKRVFKRIEFNSDSEICPVCKRRLPDDEVASLHEHFEQEQAEKEQAFIAEKENDLKKIETTGFDIKEQIETKQAEKKKINAEVRKAEKALVKAKDELAKVKENKPIEPDFLEDAERIRLAGIRDNAELHLKELEARAVGVDSLETEKYNYEVELQECEDKLALAAHDVEIDERISELQEEQRETAQKIADVERILYALENFVKYKMETISNTINSKFDGIEFKLFETQINGGIKETCEVTVNGVPYGSLNSGHRIVAGLQIIKALQTLYNAQAPIWVDNAESINNFNIPAMDNQMVLLSVSEDRELVIE